MRNIVRLARLLCRAWVGMPFHLGPLYLSFFLLASLVMTETFCSSLEGGIFVYLAALEACILDLIISTAL